MQSAVARNNMVVIKKIDTVQKLYIGIVLLALVVDGGLFLYAGERNATLVLATLPVAFIAMCCFIIGQLSKPSMARRLFVNWLIGSFLVLVGFLTYVTKDAELIFGYAMLMTSPPASIVLGLTSNIASGFSTSALILRAFLAWSICITAACLQWLFVQWLVSKIRNSKQ